MTTWQAAAVLIGFSHANEFSISCGSAGVMTKEPDCVTWGKQQLFRRGERFNSESPVELIGIMGL